MRSSGLSKIHSWINITIGLILFWLIGGVYLFLKPEHNQFWGLGELGDYFGGGLGGLAILMIIYTAKLQANQLELQSSELKESGVMRSYELFKPELEGLSVRIVSKLSNSDKVKISNDDFSKAMRSTEIFQCYNALKRVE